MKKEDRHKSCCYRHFCTKEEKYCPYLSDGQHLCNEYSENYLWKVKR